MKVKIVEANRPETKEEEDKYSAKYYYEQLNRIAKVSSLTGSPTLRDCVTQVIEWIASKPCEQPNHKYADEPGKHCGFCITCKARRDK
jgi:hypothetical protein